VIFTRSFLNASAIRLLSAILTLLFNSVIALYLGLEEYGSYAFFILIALAVSMAVRFGADSFVVFDTSNSDTTIKEKTNRIYSIVVYCSVLSVIGLLILYSVSHLYYKSFPFLEEKVVLISVFVLIYNANLIMTEGMKACNLVSQSFSSNLLIYIVMNLWIFIAYEFYDGVLEYHQLIQIHIVSMVFSTLLVGFLWLPFRITTFKLYGYFERHKDWFPMYLYGISSTITSQGIPIVAGILITSENFGVISLFSKYFATATLFMSVVNSYVAPMVADRYKNGNMDQLYNFVKYINIRMTIVGILFFIGSVSFYMLFENFLLIEMQGILLVVVILAFGSSLNIATGPVNTITIMTGLSGFLAKFNLIVGTIGAVSTYFLCELYQLNGAAISILIGVILTNVPLKYFLFVKRGIPY
jgi:O-antigen/teichoic acid export membrane protein